MPSLIRTIASRAILPLLLIVGAFTLAGAEDKTKDGVTPYPFDFCATCKGAEGHAHEVEELVTKVHKDREIKMCKGCIKIYTADPDAYVKKVDKVIKEHAKDGDKPAEKPADKPAAKPGHEGHDHD